MNIKAALFTTKMSRKGNIFNQMTEIDKKIYMVTCFKNDDAGKKFKSAKNQKYF